MGNEEHADSLTTLSESEGISESAVVLDRVASVIWREPRHSEHRIQKE